MKQPTVYKANDWILVDERLPGSKTTRQWRTDRIYRNDKGAGVPTVLSINEQDKWFRYDEMFCGEGRYNNYDVVAWQPLPTHTKENRHEHANRNNSIFGRNINRRNHNGPCFCCNKKCRKRGGTYELHRKRRTRWKIKLVQLVRKMTEACVI